MTSDKALQELDLSKEQRRIVDINLQLTSLSKLKDHLESDFNRVAQLRHTVNNQVCALESELELLKQGQLEL